MLIAAKAGEDTNNIDMAASHGMADSLSLLCLCHLGAVASRGDT